jgi:hypothetical protein
LTNSWQDHFKNASTTVLERWPLLCSRKISMIPFRFVRKYKLISRLRLIAMQYIHKICRSMCAS